MMAIRVNNPMFPWFFVLGRPTENDYDALFRNDITAYIVLTYVVQGEC